MNDGAGVIVWRDGLLLGFRRKGEALCSLPAGKVEHGEDPALAAVREAQEETGLDLELVSAAPYVASVSEGGRLMHAFLARVVGGELLREAPGEGVPTWVDQGAFVHGPFWHYNARALTHFGFTVDSQDVECPPGAYRDWSLLVWFDGELDANTLTWSERVSLRAHLARPLSVPRISEFRRLGIVDDRFGGATTRLLLNQQIPTSTLPELMAVGEEVVQVRANELLVNLWNTHRLTPDHIPGAREFMFPDENEPRYRP